MSDYKTPGVYVEEKSLLPGSVAGVSTAVPAFIGYTEQAGINGEFFYKPVRITTLKEYEALFGVCKPVNITVNAKTNPIGMQIEKPTKLMYYNLQMFFANGGESCYIVAVDEGDTLYTTELKKFEAAVNALELEDEPTLIILVDGVTLVSDDYYAVCQQVLTQCNKMKDRFAIFDVIQNESAKAADDVDAFRNGIGMNYLKYGAAYYPYLQTTVKYQYSEDSVTVIYLDASNAEKTVKLGSNDIKISQTDLYNRIKKEIDKNSVTLPPAPTIAGAYASVDRDRGVWKAPANISLASVTGPAKKITESENDELNVDPETGKSINAIRSFAGKGVLIWGARTLAGNDNEWRYVPVRRLFNYIEESVKKATSFAVFEPNNAMTWLKLRSMVESFLDNLWRQGALAGGKEEDAYFVQVGLGTTMTSQDILEGRLIIKLGIAAVRPAEFIILEFTHKLQQS